MLVLLAAAVLAAPSAWARRSPTSAEKGRILSALPSFYHQACIRTSIRVSTADGHFAAVFFRFVKPNSKGCSPFDGQVLMKRVTSTRWKKVGEGSSWPCKLAGVPAGVAKDLFGGCTP